jgi:hypothetical protein
MNGLAEISVEDLKKLIAEQGEACIPSKSAYVRKVSMIEKVTSLFK